MKRERVNPHRGLILVHVTRFECVIVLVSQLKKCANRLPCPLSRICITGFISGPLGVSDARIYLKITC